MKTRLRTLFSVGAATTAFTLAGGDHAAEGAGKATAYVQSYDQSIPRVSVGSRPVELPAIHDDGTVTFELAAPEAKSVVLVNTTGGWTTHAWPQGARVPMTKDAEGSWTVTIGPLKPELYNYAFVVDGVYALDPVNPLVARDGVRYRSELPISGDRTRNYEYREVQ
jgi:hypothetical protein